MKMAPKLSESLFQCLQLRGLGFFVKGVPSTLPELDIILSGVLGGTLRDDICGGLQVSDHIIF